MLARAVGQQEPDVAMTLPAAVFKGCRVGYRGQRLMRVGMAVKTAGHLGRRPMGRVMAARTLGHDCRIVVLERVIDMELGVTVNTGNLLVLCPGTLQSCKMRKMAAPAFLNGKRRNINIIQAALSSRRTNIHSKLGAGHGHCHADQPD